MHPFLASIVLFLILGFLFFMPGWLVLRVFFKKRCLIPFETLIFSFGISLGFVDFLMILIGKYGVALNVRMIVASIIISLIVFMFLAFLRKRLWGNKTRENEIEAKTESIEPFSFNKWQGWLFVILIALTILIKTVFFAQTVLPTATDLGHHMYWAKLIAVTGELPFYAKQKIITTSDDVYQITDPQPIADFIIGEHLPFAAVNIFGGLDFFSAFPVVFLFIVNMLGLLTLFVLALRLIPADMQRARFTPQNIALATLFFFGPLYTLASPQAKFVSGGVIGNNFGNFLIPLIILAYFRAFKEKNPGFLALGFFLTFTLAYTHHLSTLMLIFVLAASLFVFLFAHFNNIKKVLIAWRKLFFSPAPIFTALFLFIFFFIIAMPTYIETNAVSVALGTPTKTTRTGLTFSQITFSSGEARVALGLAGLVILAIFAVYKRYAGAFLFGWGIILFLMTFQPQWLFIDIPSNRIGAYLSFPFGMLAAIASVALFDRFFVSRQTFRFPHLLLLVASFSLFVFSIGSGSFDNNQTLLAKNKAFNVLQTFKASRYLAKHSSPEDIILKDHNYIVSDSWMKLFFLRDYAYPFSRGFFKRYTNNPSREQCTLLMISTPNTPRGKKCYNDLEINFVVINPYFDTAQFKKSDSFSLVYASDMIDVYRRKAEKK